jgi:hypothetical protein
MQFYSIWQAIDVFLDVCHSDLDCTCFSNALRVWESIVLRIGKESDNLSTYVL